MRARTKNLVFSWTGAALVLAVLAAANAVARFVYTRSDYSDGHAYSVSSGTVALLSRLRDNLVIKVFFTPHLPPPYGLHEQYLKDELAEFKDAGRGRVTLEFVNPEAAEQRRKEAVSDGVAPVQINVMGRGKFEVKEALMGVVLLYRGRTEVIPVVEDTGGLEYELSRRIKKLLQEKAKTVGFVTGHGEVDPWDQSLQPLLSVVRDQMNVERVDLAKPIPQTIDSVWVLGPKDKLKVAELERLKSWVDSGRTLGLLVSRRAVDFRSFSSRPRVTGLEFLLRGWGAELREGLVVDAQCERVQVEAQYGSYLARRIEDYPFIPVVTRLNAAHPATRRLDAVTFPFVHPIAFKAPAEGGLRYASLADSSRDSWYSDTFSLSPSQPLDRLAGAERGPFSLAGVLEGDFYKADGSATAGAPGRVVVVGTSYQLDANFAGKAANAAFFLNLLDWSFQDEELLSIRSKGLTFRPLRPLAPLPRAACKMLLIFGPSLGLLLAGLLIYRRQAVARRRLKRLYADDAAEPSSAPALTAEEDGDA